MGSAMAYDEARDVTILFGGQIGGQSGYTLGGDTWKWNGVQWSLAAESGPSPRSHHEIVFDSVRNVIVLFGGKAGGGVFGDTWEWNGLEWILVSTEGPSRRAHHAMAFDSARGVTILHGGDDGAQSFGDTWEWNGVRWSRVAEQGTLGIRYSHAMAYDASREMTILFGGSDGWPVQPDTWGWDGIQWTLLGTDGPPPRESHAMCYDSHREAIVLFDGIHDSVSDTWDWDGAGWVLASLDSVPSRSSHAMAYDSRRKVVVLFSGHLTRGSGPNGDTWEYSCLAPVRLNRASVSVDECPGFMRVDASGASASGPVAFVVSSGLGRVRLSGFPCQGTVLPIQPPMQVVRVANADLSGRASIAGFASRSVCGGVLVAVDVSSCTVSNVVFIPL